MAAVIIAGFDGDSLNSESSALLGTAVPTLSTAGRNGGGAMRCLVSGTAGSSYANWVLRLANAGNINDISSVTFYLKVVTAPSGMTGIALIGNSSSATASGTFLNLYPDGRLGTTNFEPSATNNNVLGGAWHRVQWQYGRTAGAAGTPRVYLNGVEVANDGGSNPGTAIGASFLSMGLGLQGVVTGEVLIDDVVVGSGPSLPAVLTADYSTTLLRPVADTAIGNWKRNNAATVYPLAPVLGQAPPKGVAVTATLGENYVQNAVTGTSGSAADTLEVELEPPGGVGIAFTGPTVTTDLFGLQGGVTIFASSFTVPAGAAGLRSMNMLFAKVGAPTDNAVVQIRTDNSATQTPTSTVLATYSLSAATMFATTNPSFAVERVVPLNCALTAGTRYWVCFSRSGAADANNTPSVAMNLSAPFVGEQYKSFTTVWGAGAPGESLYFDNAVWTPTQAQANTVDIIDMVPFVNTAQQVTTGSPKSGDLKLSLSDQILTTNDTVSITTGMGVGTGGIGALAQSFTATKANITSIETYGQVQGTGGTGYFIEIRTDSAGSPSTTVVGARVPATPPAGSSWVKHPVVATGLTVGAKYWVVYLRTTAGDATNYFQWFRSTVESYAGGEPKQTSSATDTTGTGSWIAGPATDFLLSIHGTQINSTFDYGLPNGSSGSMTAAVQGIFPTGWGTAWGSSSGALGIGVTSAPKLRLRRTGTYTRVVSADFAAAYVQWKTAGPPALSGPGTLGGEGTLSASGVVVVAGVVSTNVPPDSSLVQTGIAGSYLDVTDIPVAPDGVFMTGTPGAAVDLRLGFELPGGTLTTGAAQQKFRFRLRRSI